MPKVREELSLNLAITSEAFSFVLRRRRDLKNHLSCRVSTKRFKLDFSRVEKVAYTLVITARKFRL